MNEILKQRLVGALILVALGVVFWPIIFVEPGAKPLGEAVRIPARPSVDTTPIAAPEKDGLRPSPQLSAVAESEANAEAASKKADETMDPVEKAALPIATAVGKAPVEQASSKRPPPETHAPRKQAPAKPAIDADGVPIAWILQVASVSNPQKADELRRRLIDMGYKGYVKKIKSGSSVLLRVYVGPKFERARLESIQAKIDSEFKVKSMVRRYIP